LAFIIRIYHDARSSECQICYIRLDGINLDALMAFWKFRAVEL